MLKFGLKTFPSSILWGVKVISYIYNLLNPNNML